MQYYVSVMRPMREDGGYIWYENVEYTGVRYSESGLGEAREEMKRAAAEGLTAYLEVEEDEE